MLLSLLLCACGNQEAEEQDTEVQISVEQDMTEEEKDMQETAAAVLESSEEETDEKPETDVYVPSAEELEQVQNTWDSIVKEGDKETVYRLILGEENTAQLVVQNGIGELLSLSFGTFALEGENCLYLDFEKDMENGKTLEGSERTHIRGNYEMKMENSYCMNLTGEQDADPLVPDSENKTLVFYDTRYTPDKLEEMSNAVLHYYEAQTGSPYPGKALIDEISEEGVLIHLCEDMGDHIATSGWYLIDPFTFEGTDEIMGTEINFAPYS